MKHLSAFFVTLVMSSLAHAGEVKLAVSSDFATTASELAQAFEQETGHTVAISQGASGQLSSKIVNGADVDIFLAADTAGPDELRNLGLASETRPYAVGQLVLVSNFALMPESLADDLAGRSLALADPTASSYGRSATSAMEKLALDTATFQPIVVANVGQVSTLFASEQTDAAFVARSQIDALSARFALELDGLIAPIPQGAALLVQAAENDAALSFWTWLQSAEATAIITAAGYTLP